MPRGQRLFSLVVKRVRGSKKGTSYTRKFKTASEMNATKARYAKLGQKAKKVGKIHVTEVKLAGKKTAKKEFKSTKKTIAKKVQTPYGRQGRSFILMKLANIKKASKAGFRPDPAIEQELKEALKLFK